jgi:hypothetical protein
VFRLSQGTVAPLIAVAAASFGAGSAAPSPAEAAAIERYLPNGAAKDAPELHGSTWVETGEGYTIRLQQLEDRQRLAYIEKRIGLSIDPFR